MRFRQLFKTIVIVTLLGAPGRALPQVSSPDVLSFAERIGLSACSDPTRCPLPTLMAALAGVFEDAKLSGACLLEQDHTRSLVHTAHESFSDGPYRVTDRALRDVYKGAPRDRFFGYELITPTGDTHFVRDLHYDLGDGRAGYFPIPVSDYETVPAPNGKQVPGYAVLDGLVRAESHLGPRDPVFALLAFNHPEMYRGTLKQAGTEHLRSEMGQTHLGAYVGYGETRHSPENYHEMRFGVRGYPATVQLVSLDGVPQATLNRNIHNALTILNAGVKFPGDYKNDPFRAVDLATTLRFYRDWILEEDYLRTDHDQFTYCAEHMTIMLNVALNVPHNEYAFREIWGDREGRKLFKRVRARYRFITGEDLPETYFEPLWKKEKIEKPTKVTEVGRSLAWAPQSTSDLMVNFLETYASPVDVGPVLTFAAMMGFKELLEQRTGITDEQYLHLAIPAANRMFIADALTKDLSNPAELEAYILRKQAELAAVLGRDDLGAKLLAGVKLNADEILRCSGLDKETAWAWLRTVLSYQLEKQRRVPVQPGKVQWYSTPAITHRIALGMHPKNRFVEIREVATIFDSTELELTP